MGALATTTHKVASPLVRSASRNAKQTQYAISYFRLSCTSRGKKGMPDPW